MNNENNFYSETEMGEITISPKLSDDEKKFLVKFLDKFHYIDQDKLDQGVYDIKENQNCTSKINKEFLEIINDD